MEDTKTNFDLPDKPVFQPSYEQTNQRDALEKSPVFSGAIQQKAETPADCLAWVVDGTTFPNGTKFRSKYKGYFHYGKVDNGALIYNGKQFLSPSAAAFSITRNFIDGWIFWDCKMPGQSSWVNLREFKKKV